MITSLLAALLLQTPVFPADVEMVHVVVSVEDHHGRPVADVRPEEFTIEADGRPQQVRVLARAADAGEDPRLALNVAVLLDRSESMAGDIRAASESVLGFLDAIPRAPQRAILTFDEGVKVAQYREDRRAGFARVLGAIQPGGGTAMYDAVGKGMETIGAAAGRHVLVLLSDGEDYGSHLTADDCLSALEASDAIVYPIAYSGGFVKGTARAFTAQTALRRLAEGSGGRLLFPPPAAEMRAVFDRILEDLRTQYVVGFVPEGLHAGPAPHRLQVKVTRPGLRVRHRPRFQTAAAP
jgi:Ca-activated chloride channel family protein